MAFGNKTRFFAIIAMAGMAPSFAFAEEGGLPQLDATLFPEQLFWLVISFALLYVLMSRVALPHVEKTQTTRAQVIATEIAAARVASDAAKSAIAEADKVMATARANAQANVSEIMTQIANETAEGQATQDRELQRRLHRAEQEISVARQAAMDTIGTGAAELAKSITDKIMKGRVGA